MSEWRGVYQRRQRLEREWRVHEHPDVNRQLLQSALSPRSEAEVRREFASFRIEDPPSLRLLAAARALSEQLWFPRRGRFPDEACDDVYQAALTMMPFGVWTASPSHEHLYRGQRNARWPVVPSFFRSSGDEQRTALGRLNRIARAITRRWRELRPEQALAVIQHHSKELGVPTWLIDLTWDPAVALFFASDGGASGDLGVVTMVVRKEWEQLAAGGRNRLGQIRVIEVPDVLRIDRQRALFLDTSHPDLFEQYVAHSVWFKQVRGLVFEDTDTDWPVSRSRCYPDDDPTLAFLKDLELDDGRDGEVDLAPPSDATAPLDGNEYLAIARSWCEEAGVTLDADHADALAGACAVHGELQRHRPALSIVLRSLHRLRDAAQLVMRAQEDGHAIDAAGALARTLQRSMTDGERALLQRLVDEVARKPGPGGAVAELPAYVMGLLAELTPELAELVIVGAANARADRVDRDILAVLADGRLQVFDLRGAPDRRGIGALATDVGGAVRVLLVDADTATGWLERLARAFLDGKERIAYAEGWVERRPGQPIVVVYYGASEIGELPEILREPIVQFIA
jgi:hypothetical protein